MVAIISLPRHTPEISPCFHGVANHLQKKKSLQLRLLLAKSHALRTGLAQSRGCSPRLRALDSLLAQKFDAVRDLLVLGNNPRNENILLTVS